MKIIKNGNPEKAKRNYFKMLTCKECDCEFEINLLTDKYETWQRDGVRAVKCPCCKNWVEF